jgi:hypothetical protein
MYKHAEVSFSFNNPKSLGYIKHLMEIALHVLGNIAFPPSK